MEKWRIQISEPFPNQVEGALKGRTIERADVDDGSITLNFTDGTKAEFVLGLEGVNLYIRSYDDLYD